MQQKHKSTISVILMTLSAALGSFYFGYSLSILNFSQATINVVFGIPPLKQSYVSGLMGSFVPVGAFVGTIISSFLMARFSRRQAFIVVDLFGCLGWILSATVINVPAFIFFRFLIGVATGLNSNIVPLYINEISPVKISGLTGCLNGVMIGFGQFVTFLFGFGFKETVDPNDTYWKFVFLFPLITCSLRILLFTLFYQRETPLYYMQKHKENDCILALQDIYEVDYIQEIFDEIKLKAHGPVSNVSGSNYNDSDIQLIQEAKKQSFGGSQASTYKKRVIVGSVLQILQQFSGINAVIFYSNTIFNEATNNNFDESRNLTVALGAVNVLLNIFSAVGTNFFGRKTLLLQGTLLCFGFLTGLSVLSAINTNNQGTSSSIQSLLIAFVFLYLSAFGLSLGPLTWVYNAEILTGKGVTITTLANWFGTIVISFTFPVLVDHIDMWIIFVFFAVSCLLGAIFIYFYVVETKGLTSKEIEAAFQNKQSEYKQQSEASYTDQ